MSRGEVRADQDGSFAGAVFAFFELFLRETPGAEDFEIKLTLSNNEKVFFAGLRIDRPENVEGCVLLRATSPRLPGALVIREEHIWKADFVPDTGHEVDAAVFPRLGF